MVISNNNNYLSLYALNIGSRPCSVKSLLTRRFRYVLVVQVIPAFCTDYIKSSYSSLLTDNLMYVLLALLYALLYDALSKLPIHLNLHFNT